jgi:SH3-like domain-containing protein
VTYTAPQSSPAPSRLPVWAALSALFLAAAPAFLVGQARVGQSTSFRKDPAGTVLATVNAGVTLTPGKTQGDWTAVTLEGWVYSASTGAVSRDGFDIAITPARGENLRASPNGEVLARFEQGALLNRVGKKGGWTQVRRSGWISTKALAGGGAPAQASNTPAARDSTPSNAPVGGDASDRVAALRATPLALTPDGPQLAMVDAGTSGQVIGKSGEWVQVQLQGWVRESDLSEPVSAAIPGVTVAQVRADPRKYVGQLLEWRVQLISIQTADELRPEIPSGFKYLLTRGPLPEPGFVYVIVTAQQLPTFQAATPLQEFTVRGRLRAAQTRYLPTPVLELVQVMDDEGGAP